MPSDGHFLYELAIIFLFGAFPTLCGTETQIIQITFRVLLACLFFFVFSFPFASLFWFFSSSHYTQIMYLLLRTLSLRICISTCISFSFRRVCWPLFHVRRSDCRSVVIRSVIHTICLGFIFAVISNNSNSNKNNIRFWLFRCGFLFYFLLYFFALCFSVLAVVAF